MGKRIENIVISESDYPGILEALITIDFNKKIAFLDEFDVPYRYEVFTNTEEGREIPNSIEIIGLKELILNIDNENSLPDIGLLDYSDKSLNIDLENVSLREILKEVLNKTFN